MTSLGIAQVAGVSQATVSRVLAGHPGVKPATREKVLATVQLMDYRPNSIARAMRTNKNGNIGVVVSRLSNPIYPEMLQTIAARLRDIGHRMVVWNLDEGDEAAALAAVRESVVDGVLMTTVTAASQRTYEAIMQRAPVVLVHRIVEGWPCDQVTSDNLGGARAVADYLVQGGRRRIALIAGPVRASTIRDRIKGFKSRLAELGYPLNRALSVEVDTFSHQSGVEVAKYLFDLATPPDALFCVNDVLALGARDAARVRSINVPEQLWIVGYDDIEMCSWPAFDMTTVRQPLEAMVRKAVALLERRIKGEHGDYATALFDNELVVRGSTAGFRVPTERTSTPEIRRSENK